VTVKKVEPWNSIRVTLNITRDAAEHLRRLAEVGDQSLLDLGILSVQVDGDRIVLRTANNGKDSSEIILTTGRARPLEDSASTPIVDSNQCLCAETVIREVEGSGDHVGGAANQNLMSSEHLKHEFDQYMHGLIRGRINSVAAASSSSPSRMMNSREEDRLSERDWDAMRDALYPNELLSPDKRGPAAATTRQRREQVPEMGSRAPHVHPFSPLCHAPGTVAYMQGGEVKRFRGSPSHQGSIGALNQGRPGYLGNHPLTPQLPWNDCHRLTSPIRDDQYRMRQQDQRLGEFGDILQHSEGVPAAMMKIISPDPGVVAPKKRKRVRKQKAVVDMAGEVGSFITTSRATNFPVNNGRSYTCTSETADGISASAHCHVTDPLGMILSSQNKSQQQQQQSREPIVNPVTGLLEPENAWSAEKNIEDESLVATASNHPMSEGVGVGVGGGEERFYDESMYPLVSLRPPPNPLVALHSRIMANQNEALTSTGPSSAAATHRFPFPTTTPTSNTSRYPPSLSTSHHVSVSSPHLSGSTTPLRHPATHHPSTDKTSTGPSPRKRARSAKTNGATTPQVSTATACRSYSTLSVGLDSFRHPAEWNNVERMMGPPVEVVRHGGSHSSPRVAVDASTTTTTTTTAISSKRAVERALEMLFDDDNDEESMKLDFDLLLSKNKNKKEAVLPPQDATAFLPPKTGVITPVKKKRKSKKSILSATDAAWPGLGPPAVEGHDQQPRNDGNYFFGGGDGSKRAGYSWKVTEMKTPGVAVPPPPQAAMLGDNLRAMATYAAGRLSPFGMSPRLDERKLLLDYRRIMANMESSNVHELLESNYQMTQRNYANILNGMSTERPTGGPTGARHAPGGHAGGHTRGLEYGMISFLNLSR